MHDLRRALALLVLAAVSVRATAAAEVSVAAASNLVPVMQALRAAWIAAEPALTVNVANGSSGSLYAQITQGAPYDLFLSADTFYPAQLAATGAGDPASQRVFARGRLAVWTLRKDLSLEDLAQTLRRPDVTKIVLAQPRNAPYGRAAEAVLRELGLTAATAPRLVFAENIAQAAQFVATGHADLGFVALSHLKAGQPAGNWVEIPTALYREESLAHAAILTRRGTNNPAARRCLDLLTGPRGAEILRAAGYLAGID